MAGGIVSQPLNPDQGFNWVFLVELLICGILTVFFLFYFNRLFATLVSYGIRAYTWHNFHAYIDIQALQISLLGGRLFFKSIRYHGHNETILVHGGYITWQYWIRKVRQAEIHCNEGHPTHQGNETPTTDGSRQQSRSRTLDKAEKGGKQTQKPLPCRLSIKVSGVEAFLYNRTPAYDGIIDAFLRKVNSKTPSFEENTDGSKSEKDKTGSLRNSMHESHTDDSKVHNRLRKVRASGDHTDNSGKVETKPTTTGDLKPTEPPAFLRLFPINIDCNKGAIVVGNEHTSAVITAQFEKASGQFDAGPSGPLDSYQQIFNFQFTHPVVYMKPNVDYKSSQLELAARLKQDTEQTPQEAHENEKNKHIKKQRRHWPSTLPSLSTFFSKSTDSVNAHPKFSSGKGSKKSAPELYFPGQERWKGLTRYLEESQNDPHGEWDSVEYAKSSLIADCPCINVSFYWDVPGPVPGELDNSIYLGPILPDDINGTQPPEYGMDIQVFGGTINYGPWADRQRVNFQSIFFPGARVDAVPAKPLGPGDTRVLSVFKLYLSIEEDTVLRIPVREASKDWKWKGKASGLIGHSKRGTDKNKARARGRRKSMREKQRDKGIIGPNVRPFAWIDVKVTRDSAVNYTMDMVASEKGYKNKLDVDIRGTEISSSVNHGLLWRSGAIGLDCDLSNPLTWNSLRKWIFNISCRNLELFLLRDHLFLLTDLVTDWGSGPPSDYFTFVPFQYLLNINFTDFKLYLNTNDSNIVNNPSDLDDNNFIVLLGQNLHGDVTIPLDRYRPIQNEIIFNARGQDLGLDLCMPPKNSVNTFVRSKTVAQLEALTLSGSHTYLTDTSVMNTDRLYMDIHGDRLSLELYGFLIQHFMKIKDNYFGDDMHFKTLEEFQGLPSQNLAVDGGQPDSQQIKVSNDLDVILCLSADDTNVSVPSNLYSAEDSIRIDLPYASADLRFTNYYMDLMVNFSPLSLSLGTSISNSKSSKALGGQTEIFIESVAIYGHRLFGLPPTEPTYVCSWDFDVGRLSGECTSEFVEKAVGAARSFAFTLDDDENALPVADPLIIHDTTYLRLKTKDVHVWLHVAKEVVLLSSSAISLNFNDLAGPTFSQHLTAVAPELTIGVVDARSASRHRTKRGEKSVVITHAYLQTTLSLNMLRRKLDFTEERNKQQNHMREHDRRTNRTPFLFLENPFKSMHQSFNVQPGVNAPAMQFPEIPHPIFLFEPGGSANGSARSFESSLSTGKGRQLQTRTLRSSSSVSLTKNIRSGSQIQSQNNATNSSRSATLIPRSPSPGDPKSLYTLSNEVERHKRNLPPSSAALSSPLANPYFPLDRVEPDLSDVPVLPPMTAQFDKVEDDLPVFNDVSNRKLDEDFDHTTLIISADSGIQAHCTPEAVRCISNIMDLVTPNDPEELLDVLQVDVMMTILDLQKRQEGKGKSTELSLRIPSVHVRFINEFTKYFRGGSELSKDQYDFILDQLKLTTRIKKFPGERAGENTVSLHTTLGSLSVSVTERSVEVPNDDVAVHLQIGDLLLWVLTGQQTSINLSFRAFEVATASRKVEYLASLIHRTTLLGDELISKFEEVNKAQTMRLRYLIWSLTTLGERVPDPPFLTRPSYALRAAKDHLRNHDSWKIISRFRFIWQSLTDQDKEKLHLSAHSADTCPADAEERVIALWDQWRTWDLAHVKKSLAMRTIYGRLTGEPVAHSGPIYLDIRSARLRLIVDPGPKQSEASMRIVAVNVSIVPPPQPTGLMLVEEKSSHKSTIVQVNSQDSTLRINWEISELLEKLLRLFQEAMPKRVNKPEPRPIQSPHQSEKRGSNHDIQVIYVTQNAYVSLDSINLRSISMGQHLRFSFVGTTRNSIEQSEILSVLVHFDQAMTELRSRSRLMVKAQLDQPSLYFSHHESHDNGKVSEDVKLAGACRMIKFQIEEDILGFIEAVDLVLRDEVAYLNRQFKGLKSKPNNLPADSNKKRPQLPNITVALLMDAYLVEIALLQSLVWSISGSSGRISAEPALGEQMTLKINYDLEAQRHRMLSTVMNGSNVIATLEFPPVNGMLAVSDTDEQTSIFASGMIDTINLQASEIQALVSTINKPEITTAASAIQDDLRVLKSHFEETFPETVQTIHSKPTSTKDVFYGVQLTFSGLNIVASAPGQLPDSATANLAFKLASVQLKATNWSNEKKKLALPEVVAQLQQISIEMTLSDEDTIRRCGNLAFGATFHATAQKDTAPARRVYRIQSSELEINAFADTASAVVDVLNHLQDKIKDLDLSKEKKYLRRLRHTKGRISGKETSDLGVDNEGDDSGALFTSTYSLELLHIQISWIVGSTPTELSRESESEEEDLVLSFRRIDLSTRKDDAARLMIEDMQLQMVPTSADKKIRSLNSALLPEVVFNVAYNSTKDARKLAFQAAGKSLDLRLDSHFILPASALERSISLALKKFRAASATWNMTPTTSGAQRKNPFGNKRLSSLLVDADFAGAVVQLQGRNSSNNASKESRSQQKGRYSQFVGDSSTANTALRAPGVALKVEYKDDGGEEASLNAELKIDGSNNTLYPTVVPLIIDISNSIKEVVRDADEDGDQATESKPTESKPSVKLLEDDSLITADPSAILGRTRLNLGIRICKQEFSLSCQPIARVAAVARFDDIYMTFNSVKSQEHGHFFAASAAFEKLGATVQHVYSRESTFGFDVDSIVLSFMNSKHLSGTSGISAILKINPMMLQINARQLQDFLLFREIWIPPEIRQSSKPPSTNVSSEPQEYLIQRYQQVSAAAAFPWNANVAIADLKVELDLGQAIGKTSLSISNLWASSKKGTNWEQNLCIGIERVGIDSSGRTSGFVELAGVQVRTSISWPSQAIGIRQTPLVQASLGFRQLRMKAGFDYQAFIIADISNFNFLMYNVREQLQGSPDRLVAILDGDKVHVFCTATSAAQGLALYQALERLVQENQQAYKQSLKDIEKFLRRKSSVTSPFQRTPSQSLITTNPDDEFKTPISLHTDVVVTLRSINLGIFPSTFVDSQIFMLEASEAQARFAVALEEGSIHSGLGMTLGQLSVALASVSHSKKSKPAGDLSVEDVVESARSARGGTILRVPKVIATMHTWQVPNSNHIDYIFKSSLEGKVDVGWNYSRISYIRTMWSNHSRTLASRLGKPLPESNIKITTAEQKPPSSPAGSPSETSTTDPSKDKPEQEKITAVVNVPQSRYEYTPLETPLIETPQLRDMGEATPPLEWIGLHRDRLPHVTHQIVIVTLLEVAREVEDAYGRILGNS